MAEKTEMNDFLKKYYRRLHTSAMSGGVLERLQDNKKKDLLTGHQKEWFRDFLELDPTDPEGKRYKAKDLPKLTDTNEISEPEAEELYKRFAKALFRMKAASKTYDETNDEEASNFITRYLDDADLFSVPEATGECETSIKKLLNLLTNDPEAHNIKREIYNRATKELGKTDKLFKDPSELNNLLDKCRDGKYNSDADVQNKLKQVIYALNAYLGEYTWGNEDKTKIAVASIRDDLNVIADEDAFSKITVDPDKLTKFKEQFGSQMLTEIYTSQNIRKRFGEKDPNLIDTIEKAEGKISWHDPKSEDYVKPKFEDVLTPLQQLEKWTKDKYTDTLKKYEELRGGHVFFSPHAKEICKAIDKEKVKPTDGLKGLLDKADAIKKRFNSKVLDEHFDWFVATMKDIQNNTPKAIEGAWKDARQMKCVITQIILKATDPHNDDPDAMAKAKTAMEIMTVMKYGMLTSNVMDAFRKQEFSMFSDGKLSWNNNEGIQFVTKAFDRSLKAAFTGIGYGITFAHNKIHLAGGKFKNKNNDRDMAKDPLSARFAEEQKRVNNDNPAGKAALDKRIQTARKKISDNQQILDGLKSKGFDSDAHIQEQKDKLKLHDDKLAEFDQKIKNQEQIKKDNEANYNAYNDNLQAIEEKDKQKKAFEDKVAGLKTKREEIKTEYNKIVADLANKNYIDEITNQPLAAEDIPAHEKQLRERKDKLRQEYKDLGVEIATQEKSDEYAQFDKDKAELEATNRGLETSFNAYKNAEDEITNIDKQKEQYKINNGYNKLNDNVNKFTEASEALKDEKKVLEDKEKARQTYDQDHMNKVAELENFWNFLQSGKTTTWRFSLEKQQKKFDKNKLNLYNQFVNDYGMVA